MAVQLQWSVGWAGDAKHPQSRSRIRSSEHGGDERAPVPLCLRVDADCFDRSAHIQVGLYRMSRKSGWPAAAPRSGRSIGSSSPTRAARATAASSRSVGTYNPMLERGHADRVTSEGGARPHGSGRGVADRAGGKIPRRRRHYREAGDQARPRSSRRRKPRRRSAPRLPPRHRGRGRPRVSEAQPLVTSMS